ncbi:hypothetical protein E4656_03125 [Natronospirillum operosum]|uniref:DUF4410 domain-containing protein n=1 Tax=Natronospirillum operosum TaxID=2759953 RepID=A0A4Z0WIG5_9GAMM|nr:hypothetical protein [Natronospirillum operosum]TGG95431.1 hypothetical protein E4656_03125 [Natronospirillum operosum]
MRTIINLLSIVLLLPACAIVDTDRMDGVGHLVTWKKTADIKASTAPADCESQYNEARSEVSGLIATIDTRIGVVQYEHFSKVDMSIEVVSDEATNAVAGFFDCTVVSGFDEEELFPELNGTKEKSASGVLIATVLTDVGKEILEFGREANREARIRGGEVLREAISGALWDAWDELREEE